MCPSPTHPTPILTPCLSRHTYLDQLSIVAWDIAIWVGIANYNYRLCTDYIIAIAMITLPKWPNNVTITCLFKPAWDNKR